MLHVRTVRTHLLHEVQSYNSNETIFERIINQLDVVKNQVEFKSNYFKSP